MDHARENLKRVVDEFITESNRTIVAQKSPSVPLTNEQIEFFAEKIWNLRHFALELMEKHSDETTWHNAVILKELTESEIALDDTDSESTTLIRAADETKYDHREDVLRKVIDTWSKEDELRYVFMENMVQISQELAA